MRRALPHARQEDTLSRGSIGGLPSGREHAVWAYIASGIVTALAALDLRSGDDLSVYVGMLVVGPFLAAAFVGPRRTGIVSAYALVLAGVLLVVNGTVFNTMAYWVRLAALALACLLAVVVARRRSRLVRTVTRLAKVAEAAQQVIIRPVPKVDGLELAARYRSAAEESRVGGDLYDVLPTPFGVRVVVGDAKGKGLEAVQLAATVLGSVRETAFVSSDLATVARAASVTAARTAAEEDFVTAVLVEWRADTVTVVSCGHPPPLHLPIDDPYQLLETMPTTPLGLDPDPVARTWPWRLGDRLLLYTDGLIEARDGRGAFFPLDGAAAICGNRAVSAEQALDRLLTEVERHVGGRLGDDLAVVLVEAVPTALVPRSELESPLRGRS